MLAIRCRLWRDAGRPGNRPRFQPIAVVRPIRADSHGVLIPVRDANDRALVHLEAGSTGAVLRVRALAPP